MMSNCPSNETLHRFIAGDFSFSTDSELERHVNQCKMCQAFLESGVRKSTSPLLEIQLTDIELRSERSYPWPQVSGFDIIHLASAGAQGFIYKAKDLKLDRFVAIKLLRNFVFDEINRESTVAREAKSIAQLDHPNIVRLFAIVETDQGPALVLEWIEGGSLQEYLTGHTLSENEIIEIALKLTDAMEHAHSRGILHRDIKPSNVLLRQSSPEQPMLCDFGLAKSKSGKSDFSSTNVGVGTAGYMAPEMISRRFGRVTQASDIYSLGALIYRMVAGVIPHQSENSFDTLERTCDRNVVAPSFFNKNLSWDLETICLKCLERAPDARYQSVSELRTDLQRLKSREKIIAHRMRWQRRLRTWCHEHPWIAGLSFSLFFVLVSGIFVLWNLLQQSRSSQQIAELELVRTAETFRLSTPMIKRFLQFSSLNPNETKRIVKIAELLRDIGAGEHNLRQRFDLTYSGLEIATELYRVKDQQKLALTMASDARNSLSRLINEHATELDRIAWLKIGDKIDISLLDQAMVRYGHACIELCHMLQNDIATQAIARNYLLEAIETAEKVIAKNPEVDEAYSDLANYYVELASTNYATGNVQEVSVTLNKALDIHERMLKTYPNDTGKMTFWLNCMDHSLASEFEIAGRSAEFMNKV
ncbi:MAG: protein kinase domain-containing protein, partial [bacterium]